MDATSGYSGPFHLSHVPHAKMASFVTRGTYVCSIRRPAPMQPHAPCMPGIPGVRIRYLKAIGRSTHLPGGCFYRQRSLQCSAIYHKPLLLAAPGRCRAALCAHVPPLPFLDRCLHINPNRYQICVPVCVYVCCVYVADRIYACSPGNHSLNDIYMLGAGWATCHCCHGEGLGHACPCGRLRWQANPLMLLGPALHSSSS